LVEGNADFMRSVAEICQKFLSDLLGLSGKHRQIAGVLPLGSAAVAVSHDEIGLKLRRYRETPNICSFVASLVGGDC